MKGPLRRTMIWLHTWSSILLGWLLFAIFLTGTLSYFRVEISHWMTPERHSSYMTENSLVNAYQRLTEVAPEASRWDLTMPSDRSNTISLNWQVEGDNERRRGPKEVLNAATGVPIVERDTRGGDFLYRFHFELYGLPRGFSRTLVEIATMFMFIGLISGVIMHRKIFSDFFAFRTQKRSLGWGDAHAVTAVLALPFHVMITFSGLLLLSSSLIFWTENSRGGGQRPPQAIQANASNPAAQNPADRNDRGGHTPREDRRLPGNLSATANTPEPPLQRMLQEARVLLGADIERIQIQNPMNPNASLQFSSSTRDVLLTDRGSSHSVTFSSTGELLKQEGAQVSDAAFFSSAYGVFRTLHEAHFSDSVVRWCFFISGVLGTLMVGTGSILWATKRAKRQMGQFGFELVSVLNIASITGLCGAVVGYFWLNRLIPASFENRLNWEINGFFIIWLLSLIHAWIYRHKGAWQHQLMLFGGLFLTIPILDQVTSSVGLWKAMLIGDELRLTFDMMCVILGGIFILGALYIRRKKMKSAQPQKRRASASLKAQGAL